MNEVEQAAAKFHGQNPYATKAPAEEAADIEFAESSEQQEFVAFWHRSFD